MVFSASLLGLLGPDAWTVELEDDGVVDDAVDGGGGGHRVFEDLVPLAEDQVAGDDHGASLVALGHESEENFDLLSALLHVAEVVENDDIEGIEASQGAWESQVAFGGQ